MAGVSLKLGPRPLGRWTHTSFVGEVDTWSPLDLSPHAWWGADYGVTEDGLSVTWLDKINDQPLTNTPIGTKSFGLPRLTRNADHGYRAAMAFHQGGVHGLMAAMPALQPMTIVLVACKAAPAYTVLMGTNSALVAGTSTWGLITSAAALAAGNRRATWTHVPTSVPQAYIWNTGEGHVLGTVGLTIDGEVPPNGTNNSPTRSVNSAANYLAIGAVPTTGDLPTLSYTEVEDLIIFEGLLAPEDEAKLSAWLAKKLQRSDGVGGTSLRGVMVYGQSNNVGIEATPARTLSARHGNLMYKGGLLSWVAESGGWGGQDRSDTSALYEKEYESGVTYGIDYLIDLMIEGRAGANNWRDLDERYFAINPSVSGRSIESLTTGVEWDRAALDIQGSFAPIDWVWWVHGTSNAADTEADYKEKMYALQAKIAIESGTDPRWIVGQFSNHRANNRLPTVAAAQLAFCDEQADAVMALSMYCLPWKNGTHLNPLGQAMKGAYLGKAQYDAANGGFTPVRMDSLQSQSGTEIVVQLSGGNGEYAVDNSFVPSAPNNGFDVYAADHTTLQDIITGVSISGDTVTISLSAPASAGSLLTYGWGRAGMATPVNAPLPLGNLRDTDPRKAYIEMEERSLYNYCLIGSVPLL